VLAAEAGVSPSTTSGHLAKLVDAGLLSVLPQGRRRYFRLAGPHVGELIEAVARVAPPAPVRSLRQGTRAEALRRARTCYDHLAGRLGVSVFGALIERGFVTGGDGVHRFDGYDELSSHGHEVDYRLSPEGRSGLDALGVAVPGGDVLRYCVDWTEQRHHLSGAAGRAMLDRFLELGWLRRGDRHRSVLVTPAGERGFDDALGVRL
jgi:DNA-binding transcriptional ArsR family regulator